MSKLAILRKMFELTTAMADCARHGRWDDIVSLEREEATLAATLPNASSSSFTAREEAELIRKILADHEEVRSYVEPWMEQVKPLLTALAPQSS